MIRLIDFLLGNTRKTEIPAWRRRRFLEKHGAEATASQALCKHVTPPLKKVPGRMEWSNKPARVQTDRPGWVKKRDRRRAA